MPPPRKSYVGLVVGLVAFGILVAVVWVGATVILRSSDSGGSSDGGTSNSSAGGSDASGLPATRQSDGSVVIAKAGVTSPVLDIYEDFQCPVCKEFESTNGSTLTDLASQGKVKLVYRPFRLFAEEPLRSNSARAANAAACAPPANWLALHKLIFNAQPAEGSPGFDAAQLVSLGREAGITDSGFATCVTGSQRSSQVERNTTDAIAAGVQATPTLRLNGRSLSQNTVFDPQALRSAIEGGGQSQAPVGT